MGTYECSDISLSGFSGNVTQEAFRADEAWVFDFLGAFLHRFTTSFGSFTMFNIDI